MERWTKARVGVACVVLLVAAALWVGSWRDEPAPPSVREGTGPVADGGVVRGAAEPGVAIEAAPGAYGTVECEVVGATLGRNARVEEYDPETEALLGYRSVQRIDDHWFQFEPVNPIGMGVFRHTVVEDRPFAWADGACLTLLELEPIDPALVHIEVVDRVFDAPMYVAGCGFWRELEDGQTGTDLRVYEDTDTCLAVAQQHVYGITLKGEPVEVPIRRGEQVHVTVQGPGYPEPEPGKVGWTLIDGGSYHRVGNVTPGSPADRAGLRPGDRIVDLGDRMYTTPLVVGVEEDGEVRRVEIGEEW